MSGKTNVPEKCSENWHIFGKGADITKPNIKCACGKKQTTKTIGKLSPVKESI